MYGPKTNKLFVLNKYKTRTIDIENHQKNFFENVAIFE